MVLMGIKPAKAESPTWVGLPIDVTGLLNCVFV
jgi:hypothetical protein